MPTTRQVKKPALKVTRRDTFDLNDWDKYIISGLAGVIKMLQQALEEANRSITDYLAAQAVQRWDFEEGPEIAFEDFNLELGKVTVVQYEAKNVPKAGAETNDASAGPAGPVAPATGSEPEAQETEEG